MPGFDQVSGSVLQWPLSVLRLRSHDRAQLLDAAEKVILAWREWSDESVGVIAHTADGVAHNTVTPVIRRVDSRGNAGGLPGASLQHHDRRASAGRFPPACRVSPH